jgi:WD40 repeat protein
MPDHQLNKTIRLAGGILRTAVSVSSADGADVLVASSCDVRVHSAETGDRIAELVGHDLDVTSICLDDSQSNTVRCLYCRLPSWPALCACGGDL